MTDVVVRCGWESGTGVTLPSLSARRGLGMQGSALAVKLFSDGRGGGAKPRSSLTAARHFSTAAAKLWKWRVWGFFSSACSALDGCLYLVQDVDVVVLGGEGGVVVAQPVHHGAAGDDDGRKQGADAVLKRRQLESKTIVQTIE